MDGSDDVEGVLENLAGAGVDHGPLKMRLVIGSGAWVCWESYESRGLARHPGDEDNLGSVRNNQVSGVSENHCEHGNAHRLPSPGISYSIS